MIFSKKPLNASTLQKQLDKEKPAKPMDEALFAGPADGCDDGCKCTPSRRVAKLGFPDPIPRGGEA